MVRHITAKGKGMKISYCKCVPEVPGAKFQAWSAERNGGGHFAPGLTVEESIANLYLHFKKDRVRRRDVQLVWVVKLPNHELIRELEPHEWGGKP